MSTPFESDQTSAVAQNMQESGASQVVPLSRKSAMFRPARGTSRTYLASASLVVLLAYLLVRQILEPGYTNFLGYMVIQNLFAIFALLYLGWRQIPNNRLSRFSCVIVVILVWSDSLGNALHFYRTFQEYDKITHLLGGLAISAFVADLLFGVGRKRSRHWSDKRIILLAAAVSLTFCIGWEIYEYFGDRLIHSSRWKGWEDTNGDLVADFVGVLLFLSLKMKLDPNPTGATNPCDMLFRCEDQWCKPTGCV